MINYNGKLMNDQKPYLIVIDNNPLDWVFMNHFVNVSIFPSIENISCQNEITSKAEVLLTWDNCLLTKETILHMTKLKLVIKLGCGVGLIDKLLLNQSDIKLIEVKSLCIEEVADNVILVILKLYRGGLGPDEHSFGWDKSPVTRSIKSSYFGIIGGGSLSVAIASRAKAFGFKIKIFDISKCFEYKWNNGLEHVDNMDQILKTCDCVVFNISSDNIINVTDEIISQMKPGSVVVNMLYNTSEDKPSQLFSIRHSNHILAYVQNFDSTAPLPLNKFTNFIFTPLTQSLSSICLQQLRESALVAVQRYLKIEINMNQNISMDFSSNSRGGDYEDPSETIESALSLVEN